jgi:C4-dicarboxylate transporter, DctM subunit
VIALVLGAAIALMVLGTPLFLVVGTIGVLCFYFFAPEYSSSFQAYQIFPRRIFELTEKNVLLAIPFFVISGNMMTEGKIAHKIINFAKSLLGWLPGGLAISTVLACMIFAAISGSSLVTVVAIGSMVYPALRKDGYPDGFSIGLLTSAGSLGILIPPSIPMLVYAISVQGVDPADLFLAGVLPGFIIGGVFMLYSVALGWGKSYARTPFALSNVWAALKDGFWALNLPVLILGGIYTGLFTPTEAAAMSVVYALVVELFIHRTLKISRLAPIFVESAVSIGTLIVIMAMSFGLNDFLVAQQIPDRAAEWLLERNLTASSFLLLLNALLLVAGALMDIISAILILAPLMAPIAASLGLDPLHLGIIFIVNLEIGFLTPPIGLNLFVASTVFKKPLGMVIRSVVPFILLMIVALGLFSYVPSTALGPVNLLKGRPFWQPLVKEKPAEPAPGEAPADAAAAKPGVLSLEEMMKKTMQDGGEDAGDDEADGSDVTGTPGTAAPAPSTGNRVLTLEEMMKKTMPADGADTAE